jgi:hypothetical protein
MYLTKLLKAVLLSGCAILFGCAANTTLVKVDDLPIERVDSRNARITQAYLETSGTEMVLRGELKSRFPGRGPILGHLRIELIDSNGAVSKEASIGYRRLSVKSPIARFHIEIPDSPSEIKSLRVVHRDPWSYAFEPGQSPWSDVPPVN